MKVFIKKNENAAGRRCRVKLHADLDACNWMLFNLGLKDYVSTYTEVDNGEEYVILEYWQMLPTPFVKEK